MSEFELTPEQKAILNHNPERNARVLAGPGTGKSTTMVALVDRLLSGDAKLRVRLLTFTRAATAELAQRVSNHVAGAAEHPSTIHSFAISVLLRNPGSGGFPEPLRIADTWEMNNVVRPTLARRLDCGVKRVDKCIAEMAANWQSLVPEEDANVSADERSKFLGGWQEHRAVFGYTLLAELPYALKSALEVHELKGTEFDLLVVDEYQDLNACDLEVLRLLNEKRSCRIVGTGDDDQSIYSMRKAAPEGIRRFASDFPPADDYTLSITLRCGKRVVEWAKHVISGDLTRPSDRGNLRCAAKAPDGETALLAFANETQEAKGVACLVHGLIHKEGVEAPEILVLVRADYNRTFTKPIREEFARLDIPCFDPSALTEILEKPANRRVLALARLLVNGDDSLAWASLLWLTTGIGEKFFSHIYNRCIPETSSFGVQLLAASEDGFENAPAVSRTAARTLISSTHDWLTNHTPPDTMPENGWGAWLISQAEEFTPSEEFCELLCSIDELSLSDQTFERYLGQVEPLAKDLARAQSDGVRIMTMTGSKGLTVRAVVLAGLDDELVPRPNRELSEERRILYVAMTRAKHYVFGTWARRRRGPSSYQGVASSKMRLPSRFFQAGPVSSVDGKQFLEQRFHD